MPNLKYRAEGIFLYRRYEPLRAPSRARFAVASASAEREVLRQGPSLPPSATGSGSADAFAERRGFRFRRVRWARVCRGLRRGRAPSPSPSGEPRTFARAPGPSPPPSAAGSGICRRLRRAPRTAVRRRLRRAEARGPTQRRTARRRLKGPADATAKAHGSAVASAKADGSAFACESPRASRQA